LGRQHEATDAEAAFRAARAAGFSNVSLDLIFGWPDQSPRVWEEDLERVLAWDPSHLSLYNLIVEPGTPLADAVTRGILTVPDDDASADLYEAAITRLARAGYCHYEVSNWARDPALQARHNLIYWRNGDYAGLGAGAHGSYRLSAIGYRPSNVRRRTMNHLLPATYVAAIERGESPVSNVEEIGPATAMGETMMLGLRLLHEGVTDAEFAARHGATLDAVYGDTIRELTGYGLLDRTGHGLRLTRRGLMVANDVCSRFLMPEAISGAVNR
jgi:oxygen-independent coproporphyrinogen-3 oxidase